MTQPSSPLQSPWPISSSFPLLLPHWPSSCFHIFPSSEPSLMLFPQPGNLFPTLGLAGSYRSFQISAYKCMPFSKAFPSPPVYPRSLSLCSTAYCLVSHKSSVFVIICAIIGQTTHSLDCTLLERRNHTGLLYSWLLDALAQMPDTYTQIHLISIYNVVTPWASHLTSQCPCFLSVK